MSFERQDFGGEQYSASADTHSIETPEQVDLQYNIAGIGSRFVAILLDKLILLGETIPEVFTQMTANPAHEIKQDQLGNLSVGSVADVAVFSEEHGTFGFFDMFGAKDIGHVKLVCELTIKDGKIVYDLNAIEFDKWDAPKHTSDPAMAGHWTTFNERPFGSQKSTRWPS